MSSTQRTVERNTKVILIGGDHGRALSTLCVNEIFIIKLACLKDR